MSAKASREPKKDRDTRLLVGGVAVGILALVIWRAVDSDAATRLIERIGDRRHLIQEETTAPGASELGAVGPCGQVMIMSPEIREKLRAQRHRRPKDKEPAPDVTVVVCVSKLFVPAPACDSLARAYVDAVHPAGPFRITVTKPGDAKSGCVADYDSAGASTSDAAAK